MINQYSVFDEVEDVVKVSQVSDVDYLPSGEEKKSTFRQSSINLTTNENTEIAKTLRKRSSSYLMRLM